MCATKWEAKGKKLNKKQHTEEDTIVPSHRLFIGSREGIRYWTRTGNGIRKQVHGSLTEFYRSCRGRGRISTYKTKSRVVYAGGRRRKIRVQNNNCLPVDLQNDSSKETNHIQRQSVSPIWILGAMPALEARAHQPNDSRSS